MDRSLRYLFFSVWFYMYPRLLTNRAHLIFIFFLTCRKMHKRNWLNLIIRVWDENNFLTMTVCYRRIWAKIELYLFLHVVFISDVSKRGVHIYERTDQIWLILPVVICLSQRLSHACVSINNFFDYSKTANGSLYQQ